MHWFFLNKLLSGKRFKQFSCHQKTPEQSRKLLFILTYFLSFFSKGQDETLIFQGGLSVDLSLTSAGRSTENLDVLDEKRKSDIKNVLDDQFCDLGSETQENTCSVQNLEFRVKERIRCRIS